LPKAGGLAGGGEVREPEERLWMNDAVGVPTRPSSSPWLAEPWEHRNRAA
jgi:hypothetical protein